MDHAHCPRCSNASKPDHRAGTQQWYWCTACNTKFFIDCSREEPRLRVVHCPQCTGIIDEFERTQAGTTYGCSSCKIKFTVHDHDWRW